jgi:nitrogen fixation/metabolism regulation signal transduction histidine kinase
MSEAEKGAAAPASNPKVEYINSLIASEGADLASELQPIFKKMVEQIKNNRQAQAALQQVQQQAQQLQSVLQETTAATNVLVDLLWDANNKG